MLRCGASLLMLFALSGPVCAEDAGPYEKDTYLPAGTYASLRGTTADACEAACEAQARCEAWSLTPPTFRIGPRCELKSSAGKAVMQPAAISGVSRKSNQPQPVSMRQGPAPLPRPQPAIPGNRQQPEPMTQVRPAPTERIIQAPMDEIDAPQPTRSAIEPLALRPQPEPTTGADRPWPGLRRQPQPAPEGEQPLPFRRQQGVPAYSVQRVEPLPGDYEDNAGLEGRLPSGQDDQE